MTLGRYIFFMLLSTALSWAAWLIVLLRIDPTQSGLWGFGLFYVTLFFGLAGTFSMIGLLVRVLVLKNELMFRLVFVSFRQSISYALLIVVALWLKGHHLLSWWNAIILVLILTAIEYLYLALRPGSAEKYEGEA